MLVGALRQWRHLRRPRCRLQLHLHAGIQRSVSTSYSCAPYTVVQLVLILLGVSKNVKLSEGGCFKLFLANANARVQRSSDVKAAVSRDKGLSEAYRVQKLHVKVFVRCPTCTRLEHWLSQCPWTGSPVWTFCLNAFKLSSIIPQILAV